jgi:hypothetical protein
VNHYRPNYPPPRGAVPYNIHQGWHQRCWVHFLRDIHELKNLHPEDGELWQWAKEVKQVYERAKATPPPDLTFVHKSDKLERKTKRKRVRASE